MISEERYGEWNKHILKRRAPETRVSSSALRVGETQILRLLSLVRNNQLPNANESEI